MFASIANARLARTNKPWAPTQNLVVRKNPHQRRCLKLLLYCLLLFCHRKRSTLRLKTWTWANFQLKSSPNLQTNSKDLKCSDIEENCSATERTQTTQLWLQNLWKLLLSLSRSYPDFKIVFLLNYWKICIGMRTPIASRCQKQRIIGLEVLLKKEISGHAGVNKSWQWGKDGCWLLLFSCALIYYVCARVWSHLVNFGLVFTTKCMIRLVTSNQSGISFQCAQCVGKKSLKSSNCCTKLP